MVLGSYGFSTYVEGFHFQGMLLVINHQKFLHYIFEEILAIVTFVAMSKVFNGISGTPEVEL